MLIYYCNIRFSYKIRKVIKNISIIILGYERKILLDRNMFIETIWGE